MFGVSYNLFDGEENLRESILSIRDSVDNISIVYQKISNYGNKCSDELIPLINQLVNEKLVDELYEYKPKLNLSPHFNEINKRNIGYLLSDESMMLYHMSIDTDELYIKEELEYIKNQYLDNELDSGFCQMLTYYKSKNYILYPAEEYFVSLFYKITEYNNYFFNANVPVLVDPTRKMNSGNYKIFTRDEIQMHHYSYIRNDIRGKFTNSSANINYKDIESVIDYYNNWNSGDDALILGSEIKKYKTKYINDI